MRSSTTPARLERLETGDGCEEMGCYDVAVWLLTFNGEASHLCARHTKIQMKDSSRWDGFLRTVLMP